MAWRMLAHVPPLRMMLFSFDCALFLLPGPLPRHSAPRSQPTALEIAKREVNSFTFPDARSLIMIAAVLRSTPSCATNLLKLSRCGVLPRLLSGFDLRHSSTSGFN